MQYRFIWHAKYWCTRAEKKSPIYTTRWDETSLALAK
ncbi:MAG: hypothetical protein H7252_03460 [Cytophaga sp.]|nr:hypothetical protein [Undibacterium sp.]